MANKLRNFVRRTSMIFACLAALSTSVKDVVGEPAKSAEEYAEDAKTADDNKNWAEAERLYRLASKEDPKNADYAGGLARALTLQKKYDEGWKLVKIAYDLDMKDNGQIDGSFRVYDMGLRSFGIARRLEAKNKIEESLPHFKEAHDFAQEYLKGNNLRKDLKYKSSRIVLYVTKFRKEALKNNP
ncbi:MAG: hypothetical protein QF632_00860 [Candidatus Woesearchaeota archaeon]|jgi:hypothetical protein|nr:hypothetical protein [Candidatus Woesearchaeota archaeon]MDP7323291.1 hypothetical protein [Candidatus Woesearchaeota archaeon]MDP7458411.1 hypothetical protein [Candidatus Woesearchaeota archaeon]